MKKEYDFATVMTLLRDHGIMYVGCYYSGGGDSGDIDSVCHYGIEFKERFDSDDIDLDYGDEGDMEFEHPEKDGINDWLQTLFYRHLNTVEDWWNNDGGYGSFIMCTETGEFKNTNNTYRQETDTYNHTGKFQAED